MAKHPRLKGLSTNQVVISDGARSGSDQQNVYARIAAATAGELENAGLKCRVEEFTCKASITTADETERNILLSMKFLTTNATGSADNPTTYTWVVSSTATAGETCPTGLASAILADRSGSLVSEKMTIRLGSSLPQLGDLCDDLPLQSFEVDCAALTAELEFGAPEHLSPEDMASLLSGFRNKRRPTVSTSRATGKVADLAAASETGAIMPLSATDWSPGTKSKTTIAGTSTGSIKLDTANLPSGTDIDVRTIGMEGANDADKAKILASKNVTITQKALAAGNNITLAVSQDGKTITISATGDGGSTSGYSTASGQYRYTVRDVQYDTDSCQLQIRYNRETWANGLMKTSEELDWQMMEGGQAVEETV